jgi:hypothetical protein
MDFDTDTQLELPSPCIRGLIRVVRQFLPCKWPLAGNPKSSIQKPKWDEAPMRRGERSRDAEEQRRGEMMEPGVNRATPAVWPALRCSIGPVVKALYPGERGYPMP